MMAQRKNAPADVPGQQGANKIEHVKNIMNFGIFQVGVGFFFGICTSVMIGVLSQRAGTVGGEILLLPMMIGIAVMMYRVGRDCR